MTLLNFLWVIFALCLLIIFAFLALLLLMWLNSREDDPDQIIAKNNYERVKRMYKHDK
jgi:uncharacterized protein (TIGR02588 family)